MIRVVVTHWPEGKDEKMTGPANQAGVIEFGNEEEPKCIPSEDRPEGELEKIAELLKSRIAGSGFAGSISNADAGDAGEVLGPGSYEWIKQ